MNDTNFVETERLLLRPVRIADVEALHTTIFSVPQLMESGIYLGRALSYSESRTFIEDMCRPRADVRHISPSVFLLKDSDELVGYGGLSSETNWGDLYRTTQRRLDVELFYVFRQAYWGQGLATEMAKALVDFAVNQRKVDRVWTSIHSMNRASQRVVEKAGMHLIEKILHEGEMVHLYAIARL